MQRGPRVSLCVCARVCVGGGEVVCTDYSPSEGLRHTRCTTHHVTKQSVAGVVRCVRSLISSDVLIAHYVCAFNAASAAATAFCVAHLAVPLVAGQ